MSFLRAWSAAVPGGGRPLLCTLPCPAASAQGGGGQSGEGFPSADLVSAEQTESVIATSQARQGTLVVVDDHARFRKVVGELLAAAGWRIVGEASTGAAALDLIARVAPDVVLLDVVLPDMDGFAVADRLAAAGSASAIVLTSGHDSCDFGGRVRASPARGFLAKEMISGQSLAALLAGGQP